ncbi:hypothetical protein PENOC_108540 [Penicillium occitanis (nom. inval.)]|nr:hypothetical protein PENOC_108540 [Penicillium occitanis (nom. inval.)]
MCDLDRTGCSQCARRGNVCYGYREVSALRIVNETDKVSHVNRRKENASSLQVYRKCQTEHILLVSMLPTLEDTARSFFFTNYVPGSHFGYLPAVVHHTPVSSLLSECVQAVAIATLSNEQQNPLMMKKALKHYISALCQLKPALAQSCNAAQESTIVCVLLLGLFEALRHSGQEDPQSYITHNEGALALMELCGPGLVRTDIGYQLFLQVSSNIRVNCIVHKKRTPARLISFHKGVTHLIDAEDPKVRFFSILDDFAELQANIVEDCIQHSLETAVAASDLEFRTHEYSNSEHQCPFRYGQEWHCYPNAHVAQWWNSMRQSRMLLCAIILDQLWFEDYEEEVLKDQCLEMQTAAVATMEKMAGEICSSIPQFAQEIYEKLSESETTALASVSRLFFPLCTVGTSTVVPKSMRRYAARCLWYFGTTTRFPQAIDAARMIEEMRLDTSWTHIFHV